MSLSRAPAMQIHKLDRKDGAPPLHKQLALHLRAQIVDGKLAPGQRLLPELEYAQSFRVSRTTVRLALATLARAGLIERIQGKGTFVSKPDAVPGAATAEKRIGVMLLQVGDQLSMEILYGIEQSARSRGYKVSLAYAEETPQPTTHDLSVLQSDQVAGIILFPLSNMSYDAEIARLHASGMPLVLVDRYLQSLRTDYVVADNYGGAYRATEHLLILGHTRIGFVHNEIGNTKTSGVRDRLEGYRQALRVYGVPFDDQLIFEYPNHRDETGTYFDELLMRPNRPTAFFLITDLDAPAFLQAARRQKIHAPEDLAVVGFDDLSFSANLNPPLTTVTHPRLEIGLRAGHLLIDRIEGQRGPARQITLPTSLVVRESCGAHLKVRRALSTLQPKGRQVTR